jgi:hypothetical protein
MNDPSQGREAEQLALHYYFGKPDPDDSGPVTLVYSLLLDSAGPTSPLAVKGIKQIARCEDFCHRKEKPRLRVMNRLNLYPLRMLFTPCWELLSIRMS